MKKQLTSLLVLILLAWTSLSHAGLSCQSAMSAVATVMPNATEHACCDHAQGMSSLQPASSQHCVDLSADCQCDLFQHSMGLSPLMPAWVVPPLSSPIFAFIPIVVPASASSAPYRPPMDA